MKELKKILILCLLVSLVFVGCNDLFGDAPAVEDTKLLVSSDNQLNEVSEALEANEPIDYEKVEVTTEINIPDRISIENINMEKYRLSKEFVSAARAKVTEKLPNNSVTILLSDYVIDDMKYLYTPNRNFYYLTGIDRENFILMIIKSDDEVEEYLFANEVPAVDKWTGKMLTTDLAKTYSNIEEVKVLDTFDTVLNRQITNKNIENVYVDLGNYEIDDILIKSEDSNSKLTRSELFALKLSNEHPNIRIRNVAYDINELRTIKMPEEIEFIQNAIALTGEGINAIMEYAEPDMMEYQLESYFNFRLDSLGVKEYAFPTIAASGQNATILHYIDNDQKSLDGDLVLFDLGASFGYYSADISRTIPVNGVFSDRQEELYNIVLKSQLATIEAVKPGVTMKELSKISRDVMANELMSIGVIKNYDGVYEVYPHGISHSLGLDTHDPLSYSEPLRPGMIITVEPGLYLDDEGIGIRIEDDILVIEGGYLNLSEGIIKTVEDIEAYMNRN